MSQLDLCLISRNRVGYNSIEYGRISNCSWEVDFDVYGFKKNVKSINVDIQFAYMNDLMNLIWS